MPQNPRDTVQSWFDAWNRHDLDRALEYLADDVTLEQPEGDGQPLDGRDAVRRLVQDLYDAFPDCRLDIQTIIAEGETVAAEYIFRGTQTGEYRGVQAQRQGVENPIVDMMQVRDGQISAIRRYDRRAAKVGAPSDRVSS